MPAIVLLTFLAGCVPDPPEPPVPRVPGTIEARGETVMTVNGITVGRNMLDGITARVPPEQLARMQNNPNRAEGFLDQLAIGQVLYTQAIAEGVHTDPVVAAGLAMAEREFLAGIYVARKASEAVTDATVQAYYDERTEQFGRPQVKASHILVKEENKGRGLMAQREGGADMAELAKEHSTDKGTASRGGDLGWFEEGRMVDEFSKAAFGADPGELLGPVSSRFGFHLIKVEDKRDSTPVDEVREKISYALREEARQGLMESVRASLQVDKHASLQAGAPPPTPPVPSPPPATPAHAASPTPTKGGPTPPPANKGGR